MIVKPLYIVAALFTLVAGEIAYQHFRDPVKSETVGRLKGELADKSRQLVLAHAETHRANQRFDSLASRADSVITRWRIRSIHDTTVVLRTAHDTIMQFAQDLEATKVAGDSVVRACTEVIDSCKLFREKATAELAAWSSRYSVLDSLYKAPKPSKHWNMSLSAGFGYSSALDSLAPKRQAFVGVTIGRSLITW